MNVSDERFPDVEREFVPTTQRDKALFSKRHNRTSLLEPEVLKDMIHKLRAKVAKNGSCNAETSRDR